MSTPFTKKNLISIFSTQTKSLFNHDILLQRCSMKIQIAYIVGSFKDLEYQHSIPVHYSW